MHQDPRAETIKFYYNQLLGRDADQGGLTSYCNNSLALEEIYEELYASEEATRYREKQAVTKKKLEGRLPITLAMFVKNNEDSVRLSIGSMAGHVSEIIVVDTGSTDGTIGICESLGARVYKVGFTDFGSIRTLTAHLARQPWVLGLDSDECILEEDVDKFLDLTSADGVEAWALPRKRWLDLGMTTQLEKDVYPDWQYRFFRNRPHIYYRRRIHEVLDGTTHTKLAHGGPHIHHFQDAFKTGQRLIDRNMLYKTLQQVDISEGVKHEEKAVQELDER